ncbi:hypothetical protein UM802_01840 [Staphylococcus aureus]|nr:hypothetical protein UM802_01840 [Staphylococcus aureus]
MDAKNLTRFNNGQREGTTAAGAVQFKNQVSFDKDFDFNIRVANNRQSNTTGADGWGFMFSKKDGDDFLKTVVSYVKKVHLVQLVSELIQDIIITIH